MTAVEALILTGYGMNCDHETAYAFDKAGATSQRVHINSLINGDIKLSDYKIMVFVGGFSWGDDHGAGVIQAIRMNTHLGNQIQTFVENGNLIIGICNGFQTLVNMGILPDGVTSLKRSVALVHNDVGNFRDDWVHLKINANSPCVFTRDMDLVEYPIRHGEGKFYAESKILKKLIRQNQIVLRYAKSDGSLAKGEFPYNPNGSLDDVAGICDPTGRIFGLMPHPEAYNHWVNHPHWTQRKEETKRLGKTFAEGITPGVQLFKNAVKYFS